MAPASPTGRPKVYLHIGTMKSGTTFVQGTLFANKAALEEAGVSVPGQHWGHQVRAVQDVLKMRQHDPWVRERSKGRWEEMRQLLLTSDKPSVLSMEFLEFASPEKAKRVVSSLEGADVHIVITVRDAVAVIPALWQTAVHNGAEASWKRWCGAIRRSMVAPRWGRNWPEVGARKFWRSQDVPWLLETWGSLVPRGNVHVVSLPAPGAPRTELLERVARVFGFDASVCTEPPNSSNESLGLASTEFLRLVNDRLGRVRLSEYTAVVKRQVALNGLASRRKDEDRARLDKRTLRAAVRFNARTVAAMERAGVDWIGDPVDLPTRLEDVAGGDQGGQHREPTASEQLDAAEVAYTTAQQSVRRRTRRLREAGEQDLPPVPEEESSDARRRWEAAEHPVTAAADDVVALCRRAIELERRVRKHKLGQGGASDDEDSAAAQAG